MKKATYYAPDPLKGIVIEEGKNADGPTVTLAASADAEPFVRGAPVSTAPKAGFAVIGDSEAAKAGQSGPHGVILPERTEALRLAALAIDARKLADDAKGQQGVGALREAAEAAEKAAKEADTAADAAEAASA